MCSIENLKNLAILKKTSLSSQGFGGDFQCGQRRIYRTLGINGDWIWRILAKYSADEEVTGGEREVTFVGVGNVQRQDNETGIGARPAKWANDVSSRGSKIVKQYGSLFVPVRV